MQEKSLNILSLAADLLKYQGVYFFKNGNWSITQKCIAEHASKAMFRLFSILNQYDFKTLQKCKLFDTLAASVLNYSAEVWGFNEAKKIELLHTKFLRKILCVNKSTYIYNWTLWRAWESSFDNHKKISYVSIFDKINKI